MKRAILQRTMMPFCTTGDLTCDDFKCKTLELPWVNNKQEVSCIPAGVYKCRKINSPANGECIEIMDVEGRTHIQIHSANYVKQLLGCIAVGDRHLDFNEDGIPDVTNSRKTLKAFMDYMPFEFELEIK